MRKHEEIAENILNKLKSGNEIPKMEGNTSRQILSVNKSGIKIKVDVNSNPNIFQ